MSNPDNRRSDTIWETVAVTALPAGWRNVFRLDDDTTRVIPCPAILLQEARGELVGWDERQGDRTVRRSSTGKADPPYETRAVFADHDGADLCPASDAGNYECTLGPGEMPLQGEAAQ